MNSIVLHAGEEEPRSMGEGGFTLGSAFRPGTVGDVAVATMVSVLDEQDAAPSIERLRAWALGAGAVREGEDCAGLTVDPDVGSSALVYPQDVLMGSHLSRLAAEQAVADGTITPEQAEGALATQTLAARHGWAFSAITIFGFVCRKPQVSDGAGAALG
jgi:hypothetical protein